MATKLEYLQRYMSAADAPDKKLRKKKKKPTATAAAVAPSRTRVVDADHEWADDAPSAAAVERAWEADAADEELPVVLADGEVVDPSDLPVYVNAGEFVEELNGRQRRADAEREADLSPPRRAAKSQPARRKDSSDDSPPRRTGGAEKRERRGSDDASPPRRRVKRTEGEDDGDASPPRRQRPSARARRSSEDDDVSPPRRQRPDERPRRRRESDASPPRRKPTDERERQRHDAKDDDASPPRRHRPEERRRRRGDESDDDTQRSASNRRGRSRSRSPRRASSRREAVRSSRDAPRRSRSDSRNRVASSRRRGRSRSSPDRRKRSRSPAVKSSRDEPIATSATRTPSSPSTKPEPAKSTAETEKDAEPPARAGLFTATEFAVEHERKRRQNDLLRTADAKDLGANAETVYRDKRGRKLDMLNEMVRQQEILDGKRERQAREEYEWGTGRVQKEELKSQQQLLSEIKSAPFARREDDPELEKLRKDRVRAFDPIHSKVFQEDDALGAKTTKSKKSSKKKKAKPSADKPKYSGPPAPPNRFGIRPGYRWDGVVRGTGWEEKLLLRDNKQSADSEEAYRYAVADM